jgi:hypothetical protein
MSSPPPLRYGGAGGYGKTMLAKALAHNAPPQTTSLPLRHVWRKINNCGCSVSANTLARDGMPMDFLLSHFTLLGVDLQWWMPILGGVTAVYAFWLGWKLMRVVAHASH